jgi:hypothetical protein
VGLEAADGGAQSWSLRAAHADAGERTLVARQCSGVDEGCLSTRCCSDPAAHCFEKDSYWAQCGHECADPWTCKMLDLDLQQANDEVADADADADADGAHPSRTTPRARGLAGSCSRSGEDCTDSRCCDDSGHRCYKKNGAWAGCRDTCEEGKHDPYGPDKLPWSCEDLGPRDKASSDRVLSTRNATRCSDGLSNCQETRCCADVGFQCFEKNAWWAQCKESCLKGEKDTLGPDSLAWSCRLLGTRNHIKPNVSSVSLANDSASNVSGNSASGAQNASDEYSNCSFVGVDCTETQCCRDEGLQCFEKNLSYSGCLAECSSGLMHWTCAVRSSKSTTPREPSNDWPPRSTTTQKPSAGPVPLVEISLPGDMTAATQPSIRPSSVSALRSTPTHQPTTSLSTSQSAAPSAIDQLAAQVAGGSHQFVAPSAASSRRHARGAESESESKLFVHNASKQEPNHASSVLFVAMDAIEEELEELARVRVLNGRL